MLIEKYEKQLVSKITQEIIKKYDLSPDLKSIDDLKTFFEKIAESQNDENDLFSQYVAYFVYHKFSEKDVRLRKVSSRTFEEFIGGIYGLKPTDDTEKINPEISPNIKKLSDTYIEMSKENSELSALMSDWTIEHDLKGNKREKADILNDNVEISIKTLKGKIKGDTANTEINIGSMSYRSLFIDIYNENLGDRKAGLGSGAQMLKVLKVIKENGKLGIFKSRLKIFLDYLYGDDDFLIAFKSDIRMQLLFFKGSELVDLLTKLLDKDIELFSEIFYRWENNNLRIQVNKLLNPIISKLWEATTINDIIDFSNYHNIPNPFSKKNMVILNMEPALKNQKLISVIDENNQKYIDNLIKDIRELA